MTLRIGSHTNTIDVISGARQMEVDLIQIMLGDPQSWKAPRVDYPGGASALKADAAEAGIGIVVHSPYVINVASTNNRIRIPSRKLLQQTVNAAAEIGALGVVVHGGHVTVNDDPVFGFDNWRKCVEGLEFPVPIYIENTAGGKNAMARYLEQIDQLWEFISRSKNAAHVGFCLDTCHSHAAGLEPEGLVDKVMAITGRIDLVHCNDSRDEFASGADRHANLGSGFYHPDDLVRIVVEADTNTIIETPGGIEEHRADIAWLRDRI